MLTVWDKLKIRLAVSVGWSIKGKLPEAVRAFQATEADGVWHLHRGLQRMADPKMRAIIFTHGLEEEAHAEAFGKVFDECGDRPIPPPAFERHDLYATTEPAWKIFAYVHVGEVDATDRFQYLESSLRDGALKSSLRQIVDDESGHVDLTHRMLLRLGATDADIRGELLRVRLVRLWERWMRLGKRAIDALATGMLSVAYYAAGPFLFLAARRRLAQRTVAYDNNRLKRL